jgi:hypothetical protein
MAFKMGRVGGWVTGLAYRTRRVLSAVRVLLTRAQKKWKRRREQREGARLLKPVDGLGGGVSALLGAGVGGEMVLAP